MLELSKSGAFSSGLIVETYMAQPAHPSLSDLRALKSTKGNNEVGRRNYLSSLCMSSTVRANFDISKVAFMDLNGALAKFRS
jgi:hypothetical protein